MFHIWICTVIVFVLVTWLLSFFLQARFLEVRQSFTIQGTLSNGVARLSKYY